MMNTNKKNDKYVKDDKYELENLISGISEINCLDYLRTSSDCYRSSSDCDRTYSQTKNEAYYESAKLFCQTNVCSFDDAMKKFNPDWDEDLWKLVPLNETDSNVGDSFTTNGKIYVVCNSICDGILYNDTYTCNSNEYVCYINKDSANLSHSGDILTTKYLRHVISFKTSTDIVNTNFFTISAGWVHGRSKPISSLIATRPVLEIRTEEKNTDENKKGTNEEYIRKRYMIPQNFLEINKEEKQESTAFLTARVEYNSETKTWKATICNDFISGFANDIESSYNDIKKLYDSEKNNTFTAKT